MIPTRDRLILAAAVLLDAGGPEAVTLREVGRMCGVSHNAPYRHFADKTALLAAVAASEMRERAVLWRSVTGGRPLAEAMRAALGRAVYHAERFRLADGLTVEAGSELAEARIETDALWIEAVKAAQKRGELPDGKSRKLAALLQATLHGAADLPPAGDRPAFDEPGELIDFLIARLS